MAKNKNMHDAKKEKNNEFYTMLPDIENELKHYRKHFKDKIVFLNCDDPKESNFWLYFSLNFEFLGLKKLVSTHYNEIEQTYKLELLKYGEEPILTHLKQNGDFRSGECVEILKECDIVVTNPPFSLFREFIAQIMQYNKSFLVVGNKNAITYKDVFSLIMSGELWLGYTSPKEFIQPDNDEIKKMNGLTRWFTNLEIDKRNEEIILYRNYNEKDYPKYDNYDAINVDKVKDIPCDYYGVMGVPITFLDKHNPNQFEILGNSNITGFREYLMNGVSCKTNCTYIKGKAQYARILIKRKTKEQ